MSVFSIRDRYPQPPGNAGEAIAEEIFSYESYNPLQISNGKSNRTNQHCSFGPSSQSCLPLPTRAKEPMVAI